MDIKRTTYKTTVIEKDTFALKDLSALEFEFDEEHKLPKISDVVNMLEQMKASYGDLEVKVNVVGDCICGFDMMYYKPDEHFKRTMEGTTTREYIKPACILVV